MSTVSVIIPCYNYAHYLRGCVDSVLSQEGVDVEVLIIDDCSPDDTPAVAAELAKDPRVSYRRHDVNLRHIATYNEGLEWASGDYTVLLSADDLLVPGALARAAAVLDEHPEVGLVYGRAPFFLENDDLPEARTGTPEVDIWNGEEWLAVRCKTATGCISSPEVVVRTSLQHELGGYNPELVATGDIEMWMRFAANSDIAFMRGVDQAFYRRHPRSMLRTEHNAWTVLLGQELAAFDAVFDAYGDRLRNAEQLRAQVHSVIARKALWIACRAYDRRRLDQVPVDELERFALDTHPDARRSREYFGLRWRRKLGPRVCPWLQPFIIGAATRWFRNWLWWRRYAVRGV